MNCAITARNTCTCGVTIRASTMFCDGVNGVPAWVGLEYMAQACCAFSGVEEVRAGGEPSIGLLLGTRSYRVEVEWFPLGATLHIRADLLLRDENDLVAFGAPSTKETACSRAATSRPTVRRMCSP